MEIWEPKPPGYLWATPVLLRDSFTLAFTYCKTGSMKLCKVAGLYKRSAVISDFVAALWKLLGHLPLQLLPSRNM